MKTLLTVGTDPQADVVAADLAMQIEALFVACPNLCGFVVEDLSGLCGDADPHDEDDRFLITQVSFGMPFSLDESHQVCSLIVSAVAELVAAQPEAHALLRGRTFARTLH
jgi:hypothetical protein